MNNVHEYGQKGAPGIRREAPEKDYLPGVVCPVQEDHRGQGLEDWEVLLPRLPPQMRRLRSDVSGRKHSEKRNSFHPVGTVKSHRLIRVFVVVVVFNLFHLPIASL